MTPVRRNHGGGTRQRRYDNLCAARKWPTGPKLRGICRRASARAAHYLGGNIDGDRLCARVPPSSLHEGATAELGDWRQLTHIDDRRKRWATAIAATGRRGCAWDFGVCRTERQPGYSCGFVLRLLRDSSLTVISAIGDFLAGHFFCYPRSGTTFPFAGSTITATGRNRPSPTLSGLYRWRHIGRMSAMARSGGYPGGQRPERNELRSP